MKKNYLRSTRNLYYIDEKPNLKIYYSYITPVAFEINGKLKVSVNQWSRTTGRHLTWIDNGMKKNRLKASEFKKLLDKYMPKTEQNDFLKTVCSVSALFGLMSGSAEKKQVNSQKKRFFNHVKGLEFPEDWEKLPEDEKEKRLKGIEKIGLNEE